MSDIYEVKIGTSNDEQNTFCISTDLSYDKIISAFQCAYSFGFGNFSQYSSIAALTLSLLHSCNLLYELIRLEKIYIPDKTFADFAEYKLWVESIVDVFDNVPVYYSDVYGFMYTCLSLFRQWYPNNNFEYINISAYIDVSTL